MTIEDLKSKSRLGECDREAAKISVNVDAHDSDRRIRATLLHEMAHAADTSKSRYPHGDGFLAQLERLFRQGAPIHLDMPEMPGHNFPLSAIPQKFPLCRRQAERLEARRAITVNRWMRAHPDVPEEVITKKDIIRQFGDAAMEVTWQRAKHIIGTEHGLIDCNGRPTSSRANKILAEGQRRHTRERRFWLHYGKRMEQLRGLSPKSDRRRCAEEPPGLQ